MFSRRTNADNSASNRVVSEGRDQSNQVELTLAERVRADLRRELKEAKAPVRPVDIEIITPTQARFHQTLDTSLSIAAADGKARTALRLGINCLTAAIPVGFAWFGSTIPVLAAQARDNVDSLYQLYTTFGITGAIGVASVALYAGANYLSQRAYFASETKLNEKMLYAGVDLSQQHLESKDIQNRITKLRENMSRILENGQSILNMVPHLGAAAATALVILPYSQLVSLGTVVVGFWTLLQAHRYGKEVSRIGDLAAEDNRKMWYKSFPLRDASGVQEIKHLGKGRELVRESIQDTRSLQEAGFIGETRQMRRGLWTSWSSTAISTSAGLYGIVLYLNGSLTLSEGLFVGGAAGAFSAAMGGFCQSAANWIRTNSFVKDLWSLEQTSALTREREAEPVFNVTPHWSAGPSITMNNVTVEGQTVPKVHGEDPVRREILDNVSLDIKAGELVGVVGAVGAGKTTLVKIILGAKSPKQGEIQIGECPIKDMSLAELRSNTTFLPQIFWNYPGRTIEENLLLGAPPWDREIDIDDAAKLSGLAHVMRANGFGIRTVNGDDFTNGRTLSGGEHQVIALSRALMKNGKLMIFDEPTSRLDVETAEIVVQNIRSLEGHTRLIVSHDIGLVKACDRIIVMRKKNPDDENSPGIIESFGTHDELLESSPTYARFYGIQSKKWHLNGSS